MMNGPTDTVIGVDDTALVITTETGSGDGTITSDDACTTATVGTNTKPQDSDEDTEEKVFTNSYASKKTIANSAMNVALFMANVTQLKVLVKTEEDDRDSFYVPLLVLIAFSFVFQIVTAIVLVMLGMKKKNASTLNNVSVILVLLITAINLVISGLGITYDSEVFSAVSVHITNGTVTIS